MNAKLVADDWYRSAPWVDRATQEISAYVASLPAGSLPDFDLEAKLQEWQERGVVVFENVVSPELIDRVGQDIASILADHRNFHVSIDGDAELTARYKFLDELDDDAIRRYHVKLVNLHTVSVATARLALVPAATTFLHHVFGAPPALLQSLSFVIGSEQPIHQDFPYVFNQTALGKLAAFWIPLEDIHPDSGPLTYYPGSHDVRRMGFFDWGGGAINQFDRVGNEDRFRAYEDFLNSRVQALGIQPEQFVPKKGDLLVWHGALAHAGGKIFDRKRTRRSLVGHFTALDSHPAVQRHRIGEAFAPGLASSADLASYKTVSTGLPRRIVKRLLGR